MFVKRLLEKTRESDIQQLNSILEHFTNSMLTKPNQMYHGDDMREYCNWIIKQFLIRSADDFVIAGLFYNESLIKVICGYKLEVAWGKPVIHNITNYYVIGLLYFKEQSWKIPTSDITALDEMITTHFESRGFDIGLMTVKAPRNIIFITDNKIIDKHLNEVFVKTWGEGHKYYLEKIFRTQSDIDEYRFKLFGAAIPKRLKRPIILISFELNQNKL